MVESLLRAVRDGKLSIRQAARALQAGHLDAGTHARFDFARETRTGLPEIVLGEGKSLEHFARIAEALAASGNPGIFSRLTDRQLAWLRAWRLEGIPLDLQEGSRMAAVHPSRMPRPLRGRTAALLTAGTADAAVAEETRFVLEELGARVVSAFDVGVAGLHRLLLALPDLERASPGIYVVFAGREGALATVVAGLVDVPVVGVPTSHGYGRGGRGEGALTSMLQSCAPLAVVNIDGGIPAALVAAQVLRGQARRGRRPRGRPSLRGRRPDRGSSRRP